MEASLDLTVNDLAAKFRSKSELYNVLVREGGIYLPQSRTPLRNFWGVFYLEPNYMWSEKT